MEQALIVEFSYIPEALHEIYALEDALEEAIDEAGVGAFDGNELSVTTDSARLFMYGPDADALFDVVRPILGAAPMMAQAVIVRRYGAAGDASVKEIRAPLA